MNKIFQVATNISTPLMLAGFLAAAFFFISRQIIRAKIFPQLSRQLSGDIIKIIIHRLFILSLIAMILGFVGYMYGQFKQIPATSESSKERYEEPADDLIKIILQDISAVNLLPKPDTKNLTFSFKVIPKSKDKYVPLKNKGDLIVIDSIGNKTRYSFNAIFNDDGIEPKIISQIVLDGLIPKENYIKIVSSKSYKAICIFYYDNDINPSDIKYFSEVFPLNKETITDHS